MAGSDNGNSIVIVALPAENDLVRKVSSEKEPHLTLLYLGDAEFGPDGLSHVTDYVEYASSMLAKFSLDVVTRGTLGDKDADVLFFNKKWSENIARFRDMLLQDPRINAAYNATEQFEGWTPHLTLGYPETPAKDFEEGLGEFYSVRFDRVAIWVGDSVGPTFDLLPYDHDYPAVAMSQVTDIGRTEVDDFLQHYGIKGMKWDSKLASATQSKINNGGVRTVSNQELQHLVNRLNLEKQYSQLQTNNKSSIDEGHKFVKSLLEKGETIERARKFMASPTGKILKNTLKGTFAAGKVAAAAYTGGAGAAARVGAEVAIRRAANHYTNVGR